MKRLGEGLGGPVAHAYFHRRVWNHGNELAVGPDGTLVAISDQLRMVAVLTSGAREWTTSKAMGAERSPISGVAADPHVKGRFWMVAEGVGVFQTEDRAVTWRAVALPEDGAPVSKYLAVDHVVPGRLAVATKNGILFSRDSGQRWVQLERTMPVRWGGNPMAFAGDRLVVASDGAGVFWTLLPNPGYVPERQN